MSSPFAGKRVAIYARYSSSLQNERSVEDQVSRCAAHVTASGGTVDEDLIFTDLAISAASLKRPGFERMMQAIEGQRVDAIVAEDVSRISRDFADSAALFKKLQFAGVPLIGIADGINTGEKSAKLTFTMKSLMADMYLDDLRDKTKRGLLARFRSGHSTGGLPFGYRTVAGEAGRKIVIDQKAADIVRRVFELYLEGNSYDAIAKQFNAENVEFARKNTKHRHKGWVASSVRAILWNRAYTGEWAYNRREWRKVPGTNIRRPRKRDAKEVIVEDYPERRIVSPELWDRVQARASAISARYKGKRQAALAPGNRTAYPFSGLLFCGLCGSAMIISFGTSATYYSCGAMRKRGTCVNRVMLREDAVRAQVLQAVRDSLFSPQAIAFLRKRIADHIRTASTANSTKLNEVSERLNRNMQRIQGLVKFVAEGDDSKFVRETLRDLEAHVRSDEAASEQLKRLQRTAVVLPTPDHLLARARDLDAVFAANPTRAREMLRGVFEHGRIVMHPQDDGSYVARAGFMPLSAIGAGSAMRLPEVVLLEIVVPKPPDRRRKRE